MTCKYHLVARVSIQTYCVKIKPKLNRHHFLMEEKWLILWKKFLLILQVSFENKLLCPFLIVCACDSLSTPCLIILNLFYILGLHLGNCGIEKDWNSCITGEQEIDIFLDQTNCLTLYATSNILENKISFSITVKSSILFHYPHAKWTSYLTLFHKKIRIVKISTNKLLKCS